MTNTNCGWARECQPFACSPIQILSLPFWITKWWLGLRTSDPCTTAVGRETCSTTVINHQEWFWAQLNNCYCNQDLLTTQFQEASLQSPSTLRSCPLTCLSRNHRQHGMSQSKSKDFSTINCQSHAIRLVSCYALLGRWQPSCPLSNYLYCITSFMRSWWVLVWHIIHPFGAIHLTSTAYQMMVHIECFNSKQTPLVLARACTRLDFRQLWQSCPFAVCWHAEVTKHPKSHQLCSTSHNLTIMHSSNPEGNFRGNQLQDCSMSLSPLCSTLTNNLHVSKVTSFHRSFPRLHYGTAKFTAFRVLPHACSSSELCPFDESLVATA